MMYQYKENDVFYDFEVLQNIVTTANLYPFQKRIDVGISTYFPNRKSTIPKLTFSNEDADELKHYIYQINQFECDQLGIKPEDIHIYFTRDPLNEDDLQHVLAKTFQPLKNPLIKGYKWGFNSKDYDLAVLSYLTNYQHESLSTHEVRAISDMIIEQSPYDMVRSYKSASYEYYDLIKDQQHVDIRLLNEKLAFTSLKRLGAQIGAKILTSKKLSGKEAYLNNRDEIFELLAYNVSDIFLTKTVFEQKEYQTKFELANTLNKDFKERVDMLPKNKVLKADTPSARMSEFLIAPVDAIADRRRITYAYPLSYGFQSLNPIKLFNQTFNNLHTFNQYLKFQYEFNKDEYELLINSKEFQKFITIEFNNQPFYSLENGQLKPLYDTVKEFTTLIQTYWQTHYNGEVIKSTPATNDAITEVEKLLTNQLEFAAQTNKQLRSYIQYVNTQYTEPAITLPIEVQEFYSKQRLIVCDNEIQFDLLNFLKYKHSEVTDDLYWFYHVARGRNNNVTVAPTQGNDILKDRTILSSMPYIQQKITKKVIQFMPNDVPVFATLAEGGVHGSEFEIELYQEKQKDIIQFNQNVIQLRKKILSQWETVTQQQRRSLHQQVENELKDNKRLKEESKQARLNKYITQGDETHAIHYALTVTYKDDKDMQQHIKSLTSGSSNESRKFKALKQMPEMKNFQRTSDITNAVHTDITSYYPTLIILLRIFNQPDNVDEETILEVMKKERIQMKNSLPHDPSTWTEKDKQTDISQNARKLMLNAPSGKMDEKAEGFVNSTIRLNNKAYRMRVTGQLILLDLAFEISKTIAAIQTPNITTPYGIPCSINTDGIFAYNLTLSQLDEIVKRWTTLYQLDAEAEKLNRFISKDSNNRIEVAKTKLSRASGGDVRYAKGANLQGNADKPFIIDRLLTQYLMLQEIDSKPFNPLEETFNDAYIQNEFQKIIQNCLKYIDPETGELIIPNHHPRYDDFKKSITNFILNLQQILISDTRKKRVYVYQGFEKENDYRYPSNVNRLFYVTKDALNDPLFKPYIVKANFITSEERRKENDELAIQMLKAVELYDNNQPSTHKTGFNAIKNLENDQFFYHNNQDVSTINPLFLKYLDIDTYTRYIKKVWSNWSTQSITIRQDGAFGE